MYRWEFKRDGQITTLDVPGQVTLDDASLMLEAVLAGAGLAYMVDWWVSESIRDG
jgi:DNA-binding transcriptional LysR family regulator